MKRVDRSCRLVDDAGRACRRPKAHRMHQPHAIGCAISPSLHHEYVTARKSYGRFRADPFVRTSLLVRMSSLKYLRNTYGTGSAAAKIREFIAIDQGVTGHRLRHYIGDPITTPRNEDGRFLPKEEKAASDRSWVDEGFTGEAPDGLLEQYLLNDPHVPADERPSREKVIEAMNAAKESLAAVGGKLVAFHVESLDRMDRSGEREPDAAEPDEDLVL